MWRVRGSKENHSLGLGLVSESLLFKEEQTNDVGISRDGCASRKQPGLTLSNHEAISKERKAG